jgi:hypothetical protein
LRLWKSAYFSPKAEPLGLWTAERLDFLQKKTPARGGRFLRNRNVISRGKALQEKSSKLFRLRPDLLKFESRISQSVFYGYSLRTRKQC